MSDGRLLARAGAGPVSPAEMLAALHFASQRAEADRREYVRRLLPTMSVAGELTVDPVRVSAALVAWLGTGRLAVERKPVRLVPVASVDRTVTRAALVTAGAQHGIAPELMFRVWAALPRDPHASITVIQ